MQDLALIYTQYSVTDPEDWQGSGWYTVQFGLENSSSIFLNITNDNIYEEEEVFTCYINSTSDPSNVLIGHRSELPVYIVDDDRKLYF